MVKKIKIDKVRASRDGHEFHEAWVARRSLQLLMPQDNLFAVAVEGTSPADKGKATSDTLEVADLTLYYGSSTNLTKADRLEIVQFKYSIGKQNVDYRPTDAKKTIEKFSKAYKNYIKEYGLELVKRKITFEIITNRPISQNFVRAIEVVASNKKDGTVAIKSFIRQIQKCAKLKNAELSLFASKIRLTGLAGSLGKNRNILDRTIASWSIEVNDARARVGDLRQLVRDKAGSAGDNKNLIKKEHILEVLNLPDENALFPSPESFPTIDHVFPREQLDDILNIVMKVDRPVAVHADGGTGKTVFLQSIASRLSKEHVVILFDCFGGGSYRAPDDRRHLPGRGVLHIINKLACLGLCDLLLPGHGNSEDLILTARKRLIEATQSIQILSPGKKLILILDAIDNADIGSKDAGEDCFPKMLLESLHFKGQIPDFKIVVSSRTHRLPDAIGQASCHKYKLRPFSKSETTTYLRQNVKGILAGEIEVAFSRSEGNARILEHLIKGPKKLLDVSEIDNKIVLDDFILENIGEAIRASLTRGYSESSINAFLAGLAVLPLPIPISDYAIAHGMEVSEVESFSSDLSPMLERTRYGLMFRDEPTETLIRDRYSSNPNSLKHLSGNLFQQQCDSVYAARALPGLLALLNDEKGLMALAFNETYPSQINSKVGKQAIRYSRISAAMTNALNNKNFNDLVALTVELSTLVSISNRGAEYLLRCPDLVVASNDIDARRRLFEIKTKWQGTRHSRLAVAHFLAGELGDAYNHAAKSWRWIVHYLHKDEKERGQDHERAPDEIDVSVMPLCLIAQGRFKEGLKGITTGWKDWFSFRVGKYIFKTLENLNHFSIRKYDLPKILNFAPNSIPICSAALSCLDLSSTVQKTLIKKLAKSSRMKRTAYEDEIHEFRNRQTIVDGIQTSVGISIDLRLKQDALQICSMLHIERPSLWSFNHHFFEQRVDDYLKNVCLKKASQDLDLEITDLLPKEIYGIVPANLEIQKSNYRLQLSQAISEHFEQKRKASLNDKSIGYNYEDKDRAERFINGRLGLLLKVGQQFIEMLKAPRGRVDVSLGKFIDSWIETGYGGARNENDIFIGALYKSFLFFSLTIKKNLDKAIGEKIVHLVDTGKITGISDIIALVEIFSKKEYLHELSGKLAIEVGSKIEIGNEVAERASNYANLSRAMIPASLDEATAYFRKGLEQIDMIGSGDYVFTNELMLFAGSIRNEQIDSQDLHTLTNICELNIYEDEEKFPWDAFGSGIARIGGRKVLSKISRWNDRAKVKLEYTLLPSLVALVKYESLTPEYALSLMRLCDPMEPRGCDYITLAEEIFKKERTNSVQLLEEVLDKFETDNPKGVSESKILRLLRIAKNVFGANSKHGERLENILNSSLDLREERSNRNFTSLEKAHIKKINREKGMLTKTILSKINVMDIKGMNEAFQKLDAFNWFYQSDVETFFNQLRDKVTFSHRNNYISIVANLENVRLHSKIVEINACLIKWKSSSTSQQNVLRQVARDLISLHVADLIDMNYLSIDSIKEISEISKIPISQLMVELIKLLRNGDYTLEASLWMAVATALTENADGKVSKNALVRLLRSESAALSSTVTDGEYKEGLYSKGSMEEDVAGFIWMQLGSPDAQARWRAAHSIRCLAGFGSWNVIDGLVSRIFSESGESFQAAELEFYFLHARLWLLIGLGRVSIDYPNEMSRYKDTFLSIALSENYPHVLLKQHAASIVLSSLPPTSLNKNEKSLKYTLENVSQSPFQRLHEELKHNNPNFSWDRPSNVPKPDSGFHIDMDFEKYHVQPLSDVFGKAGWEIEDKISSWARNYDSTISSMYDSGGRDIGRSRSGELNTRHHTYGFYVGWHAIFLTAGEMLTRYPVTDDSYNDDPWNNWLDEFLLTRKDKLWLSDASDKYPLDVRINLMETRKNLSSITGDNKKLLKILGIDSTRLSEKLFVNGYWKSLDDINVRISSALVLPSKADALAKMITREVPFHAWLPVFEEYEEFDEFYHDKVGDYEPWIVVPNSNCNFDKDDPYGVSKAAARPRLRHDILTFLVKGDPFGCVWLDTHGDIVTQSEAWGQFSRRDSEHEVNQRLSCSTKFLRRFLSASGRELVILVKLERYEKGNGYNRDKSQFSHSIAVVRVDMDLNFEFYKGPINRVHKLKY